MLKRSVGTELSVRPYGLFFYIFLITFGNVQENV